MMYSKDKSKLQLLEEQRAAIDVEIVKLREEMKKPLSMRIYCYSSSVIRSKRECTMSFEIRGHDQETIDRFMMFLREAKDLTMTIGYIDAAV